MYNSMKLKGMAALEVQHIQQQLGSVVWSNIYMSGAFS